MKRLLKFLVGLCICLVFLISYIFVRSIDADFEGNIEETVFFTLFCFVCLPFVILWKKKRLKKCDLVFEQNLNEGEVIVKRGMVAIKSGFFSKAKNQILYLTNQRLMLLTSKWNTRIYGNDDGVPPFTPICVKSMQDILSVQKVDWSRVKVTNKNGDVSEFLPGFWAIDTWFDVISNVISDQSNDIANTVDMHTDIQTSSDFTKSSINHASQTLPSSAVPNTEVAGDTLKKELDKIEALFEKSLINEEERKEMRKKVLGLE